MEPTTNPNASSSTSAAILYPSPPPTVSRMAVASLVLGLLGFLVLPAIAGLVFGLVARSKIHQSDGRLTGSGVALAGAIVSGVMLVLIPIFSVIGMLAGMSLARLH